MAQPVTRDVDTSELIGRWLLDSAASTVKVAHKTMWGLVTVRGEFKDITGNGEVDANGTARGSLTIAAASIDTGNKKRDKHLRSSDFFDSDNHPAITVAASATASGGSNVQVAAEITVNGKSHPLSFIGQITEATKDAITVIAETTLDRRHVGLSWNQLGMMKDVTTISVTAVFHRAP
jgi:polyisoprenoid-binding protein YceI